jgi:hypothetical protein
MKTHLLVHFGIRALLLAAPLNVLTLAAYPVAAQTQSASVTLRVIVASNTGGGVAADLRSFAAQLTAQFQSYNTFVQHSSTAATIAQGDQQRVSTPGGGTATVTFSGMEDGQYTFNVQIPGGSTTVRMPGNSVLFVGGSAVAGGTLIIMLDT